jgi:hypothetical protein
MTSPMSSPRAPAAARGARCRDVDRRRRCTRRSPRPLPASRNVAANVRSLPGGSKPELMISGVVEGCRRGRQLPQPPITRWVTDGSPGSEGDGGGVCAPHSGADAGCEPAEPAAGRASGAGRDRCRRGDHRAGRRRAVGGGRAHRVTSSAGRVGGFVRRRPDGSPSGALQEPATPPVVDRELIGREQAHAERVARRRAPGSHLTSAPSGPAHRKLGASTPAGRPPGRCPQPRSAGPSDDNSPTVPSACNDQPRTHATSQVWPSGSAKTPE